MTWTADDVPDLTGRTAVVTGANGGLGLETAKVLAAYGAHVVMAARDQGRAAAAREQVLAHAPTASLEVVELDLGSLSSVRTAAAGVLRAHHRVDVLVNNAGVMAVPEGRTADGFETQLGVNHLGHWALTGLLLPAVLRSPQGRVVTVTSTAHHFGRRLDPDDPHLHGRYDPWRAYAQSKLANFHFGLGLDRALRRAGVRAQSLVAHPGLSDTELQARSVEATQGEAMSRFWHLMARTTGMSPARGALSQLRAATDPRARGGQLYGPLWVNNGPPVRKPVLRRLGLGRAVDVLWAVSERETGVPLDVRDAARAA